MRERDTLLFYNTGEDLRQRSGRRPHLMLPGIRRQAGHRPGFPKTRIVKVRAAET